MEKNENEINFEIIRTGIDYFKIDRSRDSSNGIHDAKRSGEFLFEIEEKFNVPHHLCEYTCTHRYENGDLALIAIDGAYKCSICGCTISKKAPNPDEFGNELDKVGKAVNGKCTGSCTACRLKHVDRKNLDCTKINRAIRGLYKMYRMPFDEAAARAQRRNRKKIFSE